MEHHERVELETHPSGAVALVACSVPAAPFFDEAASGAARMTYECCDLADLFWVDPHAGQQWFETDQAHRNFSRRRVRERLTSLGWPPPDDNDIYAVLCERSHPRWAGIAHTIIGPQKNTVNPLSDVQQGAFHGMRATGR